MNGNAYYSNKGWTRKAMTILLEKMIMFETAERRENDHCAFGEYQLGIKFFARHQGWVTIWPKDESDLNEIRNLID
jgi:hypothetical protein